MNREIKPYTFPQRLILHRATCYNVAIRPARDGAVPCCLLEVDRNEVIYSSTAISHPSLDGTAEYDPWFRQYCEDHGVKVQIFRDNGHGYAAAQARKSVATVKAVA